MNKCFGKKSRINSGRHPQFYCVKKQKRETLPLSGVSLLLSFAPFKESSASEQVLTCSFAVD
jgi:hypothetical protein